jgi:hypothetical protein
MRSGISAVEFELDVTKDTVAPILQSTITCPMCGVTAEEGMPTDACVFFYECKGCHKRLRPLPGDCCVFCSYGSVKCPPVQLQNDCCA